MISWADGFFSPHTALIAAVYGSPKVWKPEGFYITPKTAAATKGYGMPKIDTDGNPINPPYGTVDGPLRECIINRFQNNKYGNSAKYKAYAYVVEYASDGTVLPIEQQWDVPKKDIEEAESATTWYTHFVQEVPFEDDFRKESHRLVNELRLSVGRTRVYWPIRGAADSAKMIVDEMALSHVLGHDYENYREGYWTMGERARKDGTYAGRENLISIDSRAPDFIESYPQTDNGMAQYMFDGWEHSTGHYANMVNVDHDYSIENGIVCVLSISRGAATVSNDMPVGSHLQVDLVPVEPPRVGFAAAQMFVDRTDWVAAGNYYWEGAAGRISWYMAFYAPQTNPYASFMLSIDTTGQPFDDNKGTWIYLHGRMYYGPKGLRCWGACLYRKETEPYDLVRVAVHNDITHKLQFLQLPVSKLPYEEPEWEVLCEYDVAGVEQLSLVRFSQSGDKAVFRVEKLSAEEYIDCLPSGMGSWSVATPYPSEYLPRKSMLATFVECTGLEGSPSFVEIEQTVGVNCTVSTTEDTYTLTASGNFPVAKDYLDNEIITLRAEVSDSYFASRSPSASTFSSLRELVFPSGARFTYHELEASRYVTSAPATFTTIDYLNIALETVGGTRMTYETDLIWDEDYSANIVKPIYFKQEIFCGPETIAQLETTSNDIFGWVVPGTIDTGKEVDTFRPPSTVIEGVHVFTPYPISGVKYYSGVDVIVNLEYVCTEDAVTYCQHSMAGAGSNIQYIYGGVGLYNPMPVFDGLSCVYDLRYGGKHISAGYSKEVAYSDFESGEGRISDKQIIGYESDIDLPSLTGLSLLDDILPAGLL